ncbi:DMT family transporter [Actinoplanes sp. NPDC051343]|uniref:DMT family transporter n=1 Tax=Actinoplanes sp. NPDC051343 TaxID=3363906 RepID=UPI0037A92C93
MSVRMVDLGNDERDTGIRPFLYLLTTMAFFGSAFTSSKVVVGEVPHDVAAVLRFGGGALILVVLLVLRPGPVSFSWRDLCRAGGVGLVGVFAYNFFFFWGVSLAPAIDGSIIVPVLSPVVTTAVLLASRQERAFAARIVGLLVGVAGAAVFFLGVGTRVHSVAAGSRLEGDLVYLMAAGCWAAYSIASKKVLAGMDPLRATTYATGVGALALLLVAAPSMPTVRWSGVSAGVWANIAFLAIGPTAVAYLFYFRGLRSVSAVTATITMFAVPVFGTVSSVLFLGESFTPTQITGAVITVAGAFLAVTQGRSAGRKHKVQTTAAEQC